MASPGSRAAPAAWVSWSPRLCAGQTKIQRRYVQIPSAQQELLGRQDAWSLNGLPNVPAEVLEEARARHLAESKLDSQEEGEALSSQPPSPLQYDPAQHETRPGEESAEAEGHHVADEETSERFISWSSSPSAHLRGPSRLDGLARDEGASSPNIPEPPERRAAGKAVARTLSLKEFPPSSSLPSEGLEVEVPKAITDVPESANRKAAAALQPTPPSAQIIPGTITQQASPVPAPVAKRRRRMINPALKFDSPDGASQRQAPPRLALPDARPRQSSQHASSVVSSSPPINKTPPRHATETSPVSLPAVDDAQSPLSKVRPSLVPATSQFVSNQQQRCVSADTLPSNGPPPRASFAAFKLAYPDYGGSLGDFLRGIMCLFQLQKKRALPQFLYDDFIRVFSGEYLDYISAVVGTEQPLPAVQWYNERVLRPLYTKGVLTKSNIGDIPNQYPDEFRAIQHKLDSDPEPVTERSRSTPEPRTNAASPVGTASRSGPGPSPQHAGIETARLVGSAGEVEPVLGALHDHGDLAPPKTEQAHAPQAAGTQAPVASARPGPVLSQLSNPESIPEVATKRRQASRASAGSSVGEPSAAFKRPRRGETDAEKRALRFRKFLMQRSTQGSAPGGSSAS